MVYEVVHIILLHVLIVPCVHAFIIIAKMELLSMSHTMDSHVDWTTYSGICWISI